MRENHRILITFFPECENVHLTKDVGMIPFILHREFQYDSYVVCYQNGDYPRLEREVKGLKILFLQKHAFSPRFLLIPGFILNNRLLKELHVIFDALVFFTAHRKRFTVLQVFHLQFRSFFIALIFRLLNRNGIIYLKLDMNPDIVEDYRNTPKIYSIVDALKMMLITCIPVHILSAETNTVSRFLSGEHRFYKKIHNKVYYLPNGVDIKNDTFSRYLNSIGEKENIILHVGRIGLYEKGSEIIIEAFSRISDQFPGWSLIFVGAIEPAFEDVLRHYQASNVTGPGKIRYTGLLPSYSDVFGYYQKAKVIAMPSRSESFGLALIEAGLCGDIILGSKIPAIQEITCDGLYAFLCEVDDVSGFSESLCYIITHQAEARGKSSGFREYIVNQYDWNKICAELNRIIEKTILH